MLQPNAFNRLVSKVVVENVVGLAKVRFNWCRVLKQRRVPLIAVATDEAVEVFEPEAQPDSTSSRAHCASCQTRMCCT